MSNVTFSLLPYNTRQNKIDFEILRDYDLCTGFVTRIT